MEFPHLERLSRAESRQLLPGASVGRLAVPTLHFPTLEPVSFAVIEGELIVAVRAGSAGDALAAGTDVTFQADSIDHANRRGWSVVVSGAVEELDADVVPLVRPLLTPWPVVDGDRLLLIRSERITGVRVVTEPAPTAGEEAAAVTAGTAPLPTVQRVVRRSLNID